MFELALSSIPLSRSNFPRLQGRIFLKVKTSFPPKPLAGLAGHQRWGMEECAARLVQTFPDLQKNWSMTCLLTSTFAEASHDRGFKTWQTPATYPECIFCGRKYRWGAVYVECHMDPNISKATTGKERVVAACAESQSTSRGPNRTRFLAVQAAIRAKMQ
jgi:hypothetical protein